MAKSDRSSRRESIVIQEAPSRSRILTLSLDEERIDLRDASPPRSNPWQRNEKAGGNRKTAGIEDKDSPVPSKIGQGKIIVRREPSSTKPKKREGDSGSSRRERSPRTKQDDAKPSHEQDASRQESSPEEDERSDSETTPKASRTGQIRQKQASPTPATTQRKRIMKNKKDNDKPCQASQTSTTPTLAKTEPGPAKDSDGSSLHTGGQQLESMNHHPTPTLADSSANVGSSNNSARNYASLWTNPEGSDIRVHVTVVDGGVYRVHRDILQQSGWFRDNVAPARENGAPVDIAVRCAPSAAVACLYFMYHSSVFWCEDTDIFNTAFLPRCVLLYSGALHFRIPSMVAYVLRKIETRADALETELMYACFIRPSQGAPGRFPFSPAMLQDPLNLIYQEPNQLLMKPLRMVMARLFDMLTPCLVSPPLMQSANGSEVWQRCLPLVIVDVLEWRYLWRIGCFKGGSTVPTDEELQNLVNEEASGNAEPPRAGDWSQPSFHNAEVQGPSTGPART